MRNFKNMHTVKENNITFIGDTYEHVKLCNTMTLTCLIWKCEHHNTIQTMT